MARLFTSGAEFNDTTLEQITLNSQAQIDTTSKRNGTYGYHCGFTGGGVGYVQPSGVTGVRDRLYSVRAYYYFTDDNSSSWLTTFLSIPDVVVSRGDGGSSANKKLAKLYCGASSSLSSFTLTENIWYCVELQFYNATAASSSYATLKIDGNTVASLTNITTTQIPTTFQFGYIVSSNITGVYIDDIVINDDQGASQTSWVGRGGVFLALPVSDNAVASLWTGGAGGTTNLYDGVNNTPPIGTATETDLTQIEHAGGAAGTTDAYDANMTDYLTLGAPNGSTINTLQLVGVDGEDAATGVKVLAYSVVSNPAIASSGNVNAGDDVGALGTYPTNWAIHRGTLTYSPTVTLGTSPVMRALRPETANRVASVAFMGIVGDYSTTGLEFSRGSYSSLPADDADLTTIYSPADITDVASDNAVRVNQSATGQYSVHQFKHYVGPKFAATITWNGQTDFSPASSTVYMQIYNRNSTTWETIDSDNTTGANTDFDLIGTVSDLTNYKDSNERISWRIYQLSI